MIKNKKLSLLFFSMLLVGQSVFSSIKEEEVQAEETTQEDELVSYSDQTGLFLSMDEDGNITYVEPEMADEETDTTLPEEEDSSTTFDVKLETEDGDVIDVDEFSTMEEAQMYVDVMEMNKELSSLIEDIEEEEETSIYEGTSSSDEEESTTSTAGVTSKTRSSEITYLSDEEEIEDYEVSIYTNDKLRATTATSVVVFTNYSSTTSYYEDGTGISGYTNANYAADAAYLGTSGTKVKFMLAGVTGWVDASNVSIVTYSSSLNVSYYKVTNGKLYHYISTNINGSGPASAQYMGTAPSYLTENTKYYSYDGHYFYSSYATMISDYQSGSVSNSVNPKSAFYNYYQYLSQRSQTSFTASELNTRINNALKSYTNGSSSILKDQGSNLIAAEQYGVNAALVLGLAANESAWGLSSIALNKNNLFGLNAVDSSPGTSADTFASAAACINDFAKNWVSLGYADPTDWRYYGSHYGDKQSGMNVKYASDPYWGEKAAAQGYYLEDQTGKSDSTKYSIAVNNGEATYVYKEASTSSKILYGTGNTNFKTIYEYPVIVLDTVTNSEGTWYKIKSDAILNSSRTALSTASTGIYDHSLNYVYIQVNGSFPIVHNASGSSSGSSSSGSSSDSSSSGSSSSGSSSGSTSSGSNSSSSSSSSSTSSSTSTTLGDVNGDGKISSLDYIKVKNHIMGTKTLTSDEQTRADVNKDGKITSLDYIKIKNHIMGTSKIS